MLIDTAIFGALEVEDDHIFHMPEGPFGFSGGGDYALLSKQDDGVTLMWFQAVESTVPCFVVFDPKDIIDGFDPVLDASDLRALDCKKVSDLQFLVIAVIPEDITGITVNFKSPIVLNRQNNLARQVILANDYPIRFPLAPVGEPQGKAAQ